MLVRWIAISCLIVLLVPFFRTRSAVNLSRAHELFPDGFLWGASTSAHQIEGGNVNDWSLWEDQNAERLALEAGNNLSADNYRSGVAADGWNRYEEDFSTAQSLGLTAYRFSVEWSRIEPRPGEYDAEALEHYRQQILALRARGIEPFVTLWHWTLPVWVSEAGGWENPDTAKWFAAYVDRVAGTLGDEVTFWITLNEPQVYTAMPYYLSRPPTQRFSPFSYLRIRKNLLHGHQLAYETLKRRSPSSQVGIANNTIAFTPRNSSLLNVLLVQFFRAEWNTYYLDRIGESQDFIGVNYYFHRNVGLGFRKYTAERVSDLGWELYPEGLYEVLRQLSSYGKPLYITEHGLADADDSDRAWYIKTSLMYARQALADGADVRGYMHWSLLDNFEWADGFWPRFGLVAVDYETQKRTVRPSALEYAKIIRENRVQE